MEMFHWLIVPAAILGVVIFWCVFWCAICFLIALMSGWFKLAKHFQTTVKPEGKMLYKQRARINLARYADCLTVGVTPVGLYLEVWPAFRAGHPPLLIPWSAVGPFKTEKFSWVYAYTTTVKVGASDRVTMTFLDKNVMEAAQPHLSTAN